MQLIFPDSSILPVDEEASYISEIFNCIRLSSNVTFGSIVVPCHLFSHSLELLFYLIVYDMPLGTPIHFQAETHCYF